MTIVRIERDEDVIEAMEADLLKFAELVKSYEYSLREKAAERMTADLIG